jgi:hypothetical protein
MTCGCVVWLVIGLCVQYIASGQEPRTFVVMERLEGGSLNQRLGFAPTHTGTLLLP